MKSFFQYLFNYKDEKRNDHFIDTSGVNNTEDAFITNLKQNHSLWDEILNDLDKFIICCPIAESLPTTPLSSTELKSHIIREDADAVNADESSEGCFLSMNGETLYIIGSSLVCGSGYDDNRKVKILTNAQIPVHFPEQRTCYANAFIINRPLRGGIVAPEESDEIGGKFVKKYVAALRSYPEMEAAFVALDGYIEDVCALGVLTPHSEGFNSITPSLPAALRCQWERTVNRITRTGDIVSSLGSGRREQSAQQIAQIVESYLMLAVHHYVYPWFCRQHNDEKISFENAVVHLCETSQTELQIDKAFQSSQQQAIDELCKLDTAHTPVDKMLVLKSTVELVRAEVEVTVECNRNILGNQHLNVEFATDDLVMIIIWVIIYCSKAYSRILIDIRYCEQFHFRSSSQSDLGYNLCHFQVACTWLLQHEVTDIKNRDDTI